MADSIDITPKEVDSVQPEKQATFQSEGTGDSIINMPDSRATTAVVEKVPKGTDELRHL